MRTVPGSGTVTLLFTDLVGSTEMLDRLGDDAAEEVRRIHFGLLRDAAVSHGGREVKSLGDGLMVAFPSALQAVASAVTMQQRVRRHNGDAPDRPLGLRVGLNVGEAITEEHDYFGTPVVVAKRLCDRAAAGEVLLSALVRGLVGSRGGYEYREVGPLALKGLHEPVSAWQLLWDQAPEAAAAPAPGLAEPAPAEPAEVPLQAALVSAARGRFVGREADLERVRETFASVVADGSLRLVLITGEPGIGKTRLAAEFAHEAHSGGAIVLYGRSDEEALVPYQPFVEALGHWVAHAPADRLRRQAEGRAELLRLLPELGRRVPGLEREGERDPETERYRLFEAAVGVLRDLAATAPIVLVLDDLHWVDKPTALLMRHASRSCGNVPMLVVCTYRGAEVGRGHPLAEAMADVRRHTSSERLILGGLGADAVRALIATRAGAEPAADLVDGILAETEGNPFFVGEVVEHLLESEALAEEGGRLVARVRLAEMGIPESVREIIDRRLAHLSDTTRRILSNAAVMGREFDLRVLEQVGGVSGDAVADAVDEALAGRVVEEVGDALDRYAFVHTLIRHTLYDDLSRTRRLQMHHRVAETLERLHADEAEYFPELAYHYVQAAPAGDADKAVEYAIRAGRRASEQLAYEEAAVQYERALHVLDLSRADALRRCELLLACGEAEWNAGEFDRARDAYKRAAELADRLEAPEHLARAALGCRGLVGYQTVIIDHVAIDLLERALRAGPQEAALRARVMAALAESAIFTVPLQRREALARDAIELVAGSGDQAAHAAVLLATHWTLWNPDNLEQRSEWARQAGMIGAAAGDAGSRALGTYLEYADLMEGGDPQAAITVLRRAIGIMKETRQRYLVWLAAASEAQLALLNDGFEAAEERAAEALAVGQHGQNHNALQAYAGQIVLIRREQGRLGELEAGTRAFVAQFPEMAIWRCVLTMLYAETGRAADAARELDAMARDDFAAIPVNLFWLTCVFVLAWACSDIEDQRHAPAIYARLEPFAELRPCPAGLLPLSCVAHMLGRLATVIGRWDDAVRHLERALEIETGADAHWLGHVQRDLAQALIGRDGPLDRERAFELLDQAQAVADRWGMTMLTEWIDATRRAGRGERGDGLPSRPTLGERATQVREEAAGMVAKGSQAAIARMVRHLSDAQIERRFGSPIAQRMMFTSMAQAFQSKLAYGFEGAILYELTRADDHKTDCWTVTVNGKKASAQPGRRGSPALTLRLALPDFVRIVAGELNPVGAMLERRTEVEGDVTLAARLVQMFGGAPPDA